jgi:hypothetical protein
VLKENAAVLADIRKQFPSAKKVGIQGCVAACRGRRQALAPRRASGPQLCCRRQSTRMHAQAHTCLLPTRACRCRAPRTRFCWGGLYAVLHAQGTPPDVAASVVYHGSLLAAADVAAVTAPILFQQSDPALDRQIPTALYKEVRRWWRQRAMRKGGHPAAAGGRRCAACAPHHAARGPATHARTH